MFIAVGKGTVFAKVALVMLKCGTSSITVRTTDMIKEEVWLFCGAVFTITDELKLQEDYNRVIDFSGKLSY